MRVDVAARVERADELRLAPLRVRIVGRVEAEFRRLRRRSRSWRCGAGLGSRGLRRAGCRAPIAGNSAAWAWRGWVSSCGILWMIVDHMPCVTRLVTFGCPESQ